MLRGIAVFAALALAGCSLSLPGLGPAPDLYDLSPKSTFPDEVPSASWQLVVEAPNAPTSIDTDRVAIKPGPLELKYFPTAKWTDRAPAMVQMLLIESFENSGKIVAVGRRAIGLSGDYVLKSELREFQAERFGPDGATTVRVRINLKLVRVTSGIIIASESFERQATAASDTPRDVVLAFDEALGGVLKRAVLWTLEAGNADHAKNDEGF